MQTRLQSAVEAVTNTVVGASGNWIITILAINLIDNRIWATTVTISGCTIWSLGRNYFLRRKFETVAQKKDKDIILRCD